MERVSKISKKIGYGSKYKVYSQPGVKTPKDVVIVSALRTPCTRARKGGLNYTKPEQMLKHVFKAVLDQTGIDSKLIDDIAVGNVLLPGSGALLARAAQMLADMPVEIPVFSINRQCSSGLEAVISIASKISSGIIKCGIGSGVESMSNSDMNGLINPDMLSDDLFDNERAANCLIPMGQTSEILSERYGLKRVELDQFAVESHKRAAKARRLGWFKDEIVPMKVQHYNTKTKKFETKVISEDDGIRENTTMEILAKIKPSFKRDGLSTPGNSSQITDGAAAVLMMTREMAESLGLKILGKVISHTAVGVPPEIMGIGPLVAIPDVLKKSGLTKDDIGVFEINEAFASQCYYCMKELGLDHDKVNPKGGAIALGHPLGCTGARQVATLLTELHRRKEKYGIISMCMGTGMGAAAIFEAEY